MSLIVDHDGLVSQSDIGPDTTKIDTAMIGHNPTADRQPVSK